MKKIGIIILGLLVVSSNGYAGIITTIAALDVADSADKAVQELKKQKPQGRFYIGDYHRDTETILVDSKTGETWILERFNYRWTKIPNK